MTQPSDSVAHSRKHDSSATPALLFIAIGLFMFASFVLVGVTRTVASIVLQSAGPQSRLPGPIQLTALIAIPILFVLGWAVACMRWFRAVAARRPGGAARAIALGAPLSAAILASLLFIMTSFSVSRGIDLFICLREIAGGAMLVTPFIIAMIGLDALRLERLGQASSLWRILWQIELPYLLPAVVAGAVIGGLSAAAHPNGSGLADLTDIALRLAVVLWSYWQVFQIVHEVAQARRTADRACDERAVVS